jgi:hypothetical protein
MSESKPAELVAIEHNFPGIISKKNYAGLKEGVVSKSYSRAKNSLFIAF